MHLNELHAHTGTQTYHTPYTFYAPPPPHRHTHTQGWPEVSPAVPVFPSAGPGSVWPAVWVLPDWTHTFPWGGCTRLLLTSVIADTWENQNNNHTVEAINERTRTFSWGGFSHLLLTAVIAEAWENQNNNHTMEAIHKCTCTFPCGSCTCFLLMLIIAKEWENQNNNHTMEATHERTCTFSWGGMITEAWENQQQ